jgi:hypothetical protein
LPSFSFALVPKAEVRLARLPPSRADLSQSASGRFNASTNLPAVGQVVRAEPRDSLGAEDLHAVERAAVHRLCGAGRRIGSQFRPDDSKQPAAEMGDRDYP